jgi:hypothetical protein
MQPGTFCAPLGGIPANAAGDCDRWSHYNMCNTDLFCNIQMKHLQHTSETIKTLAAYV